MHIKKIIDRFKENQKYGISFACRNIQSHFERIVDQVNSIEELTYVLSSEDLTDEDLNYLQKEGYVVSKEESLIFKNGGYRISIPENESISLSDIKIKTKKTRKKSKIEQ